MGGASALILPLIDLLILTGTATLVVGFVLKAVDIATRYHPTILGFSSLDFLLMTGVAWGFALVLAARSWVRLNEPKLLALRREQMHAQAMRQAQEAEAGFGSGREDEVAPKGSSGARGPEAPARRAAGGDPG